MLNPSIPPPSYTDATSTAGSSSGPYRDDPTSPLTSQNPPLQPGMTGYAYPGPYQQISPPSSPPPGRALLGPSENSKLPRSYPTATPQDAPVYWYRNAHGHTFSSSFPPTHPEMRCLLAQGHQWKNHHGWLGWVMGIVFFPLGCLVTAVDYQTRCRKCGAISEQGFYTG